MRTETQRMDSQRMDSPPTQVRAAFVGGVFAVLTACITGTFLIANTLIQNGFVITGPVVHAGGARAAETAVPDTALDTYVEAGSLLCALGGPVELQDADQAVEVPAKKGPTIVCWIGPQQARATIASGTIVRQVSLDRQDLQAAALAAARGFAEELGERVEIAIIAQDGTVSKP